ncbi:MAG TPA: hypothetical protein VGP58_12825, partial [Pyrinomonadaceae bacterium]|nr:hypothetical protein [Pyrinomonadaceae bacterium]
MMKTNSIFKRNFCGRRAVAKTFCLSLSAFCVLFFAGNISAQKNNSKRRTNTKASQVQPKITIPTSDKTANAVTVVNRVEA